MSKVPSSCEIRWLAIKQHDLTMIYINLFARAIVTELTPLVEETDSTKCAYFFAGKWGRGGSWSPRAPSQSPLMLKALTAAAANNSLQLWHSALLTSTWRLGDPHPGAISAAVWRAFSSQDQQACFSFGSFNMSSFQSDRQGLLIQSLKLQATPNPILPRPHHPTVSVSLLPPYQKAVEYRFVIRGGRAMKGIKWCGFGSLPSKIIARQTDSPGVFWSGVRGQGMLPRVSQLSHVRVRAISTALQSERFNPHSQGN